MFSLSGQQLIEIMCRTLNRINPGLVGHGERVAVITHQILNMRPELDSRDRAKYIMLGFLHDIGANKTDEINQMLLFDSTNCWAHSVYSYLYLKEMSPLGDFAHPVLYHHLPYKQYSMVTPPMAEEDYAGLFFLADRIEIITRQKGYDACITWISKNRGTLFAPYWVDLFLAAEAHTPFLKQLESKKYGRLLDDLIREIDDSGENLSAYLSVIAYSIDFRSEFMLHHTINTVCISQVLGKRTGLAPDELEALYFGALLHDLGKVSCPVEILEKPGRLTSDEMVIMRRHIIDTREILDGLIDPTVLEIACRHHERLDGSGYPQSLTADVLTLPQRILAVADVVSALIRRRSYKAAYDKQVTLNILTDLKEKNQFCDIAIDLVLDHFDEIVRESDFEGAAITNAYENIHHEYEVLMKTLSPIV